MRLLFSASMIVACAVAASPADATWRRPVHAVGPAPSISTMPTPAGSGDLVVYASLAEFQAATAGMAIRFEDFSERPNNNFSPCYEPVNHRLGQPGTNFLAPTCFQPEELVPGFSLRSDLGYSTGTFGTFAIGANAVGVPSVMIGAMSPGLVTIIDFLEGPVAVAFDGYDWQAGSQLMFTAYGMDGTMLGTFSGMPSAPNQPVFAGFVSPQPVRRVTVRGVAGASQMISNLRFGGTAGFLAADAGTIDFGAVALDDQAFATLGLGNAGDTPVAVFALPDVPAPFSIAEDGCGGQTLAPGASCTIEIGFQPALRRSESHVFALDDGNPAAIEVALRGRGAIPTLTADSQSLHFGTVAPGGSATRVLLLRNVSAADVELAAIPGVATPFGIDGGSCAPLPFVLAPGASCTLVFRFDPVSEAPATGHALIESNDPASPYRIRLLGNGADLIFADGFE